MSNHLWRVTAKRQVSVKVAAGMWVEIVVSNTNRKPLQKEIINALNAKYGEGTAPTGLSIGSNNFDIVKL